MFSVGKQHVALALLPLATAAMAIPSPTHAAETSALAFSDASVPSPVSTTQPAEFGSGADSAPALADPAGAGLLAADAAVTWDSAHPDLVAASGSDTAALDPELECMAKVVLHEAGRSSREGQLAVAQVIMNRMQSGRFAATICGVANQPGQFFHTASYNPPRSAAWQSAVAVARQVRDGDVEPVAPGALFFHAASAGAFRNHQRVAMLGGNVFYR